MNERFFCYEDPLKKQLKTIVAFHHERYAWNPEKNKNGIIYAFRYHGHKGSSVEKGDNLSVDEDLPQLNGFRFESTTQMLHLIEKRCRKKGLAGA